MVTVPQIEELCSVGQHKKSSQDIIINDLQLTNLQTFIVTAQTLSFQNAAECLNVSASAVSHRISKLEKQLDFPLFQRFVRKIKLTHEGERLYDVLKESFDKINSEIQDIRNNEFSGTLTIFFTSKCC